MIALLMLLGKLFIIRIVTNILFDSLVFLMLLFNMPHYHFGEYRIAHMFVTVD